MGTGSSERIPRTVKGLAFVSLFNDFASEMVYPLLPAFVTGVLGGGAMALGALDGAADLTASITKWFSGRLADRRGWRRPLILGGYLTAVLIRPLISVAGAAWQVIGFRVIDRLGKGLRTPARDALIADVTPPPIRGRAFGFHRAADHFGSIPGSLMAWWLLDHAVDVRRILAWSAAPGVVAFVILLFVLTPGRPEPGWLPAPDGTTPTDATGRVFWVPVVILATLVLLRLPEALLLLRLQDLGVRVALIPLVWAGLHVVRTIFSYPGVWLSDHTDPRATIAAGGVVFALVAFGLGESLTPGRAVAAFLAMGLVAALTESAERVMVSRLAPVRSGRGFGAYHALTGFAALPAGLIFGGLYQSLGASVALHASAFAIIAVVLLWAMVVFRPRSP
jgi:MFS family permease